MLLLCIDMTTYTYSVSNGLATDAAVTAFTAVVDSDIGGRLGNVQVVGDSISITFNQALTADNINKLNNLIDGSFIDKTVKYENAPITVTPRNDAVNTLAYGLVCRVGYKHNGSTIGAVHMIARISSSVYSYNVKVIDKANNNTIALSAAMTNTDYSIIDLGTITNAPTSDTTLEVYACVSDKRGTANIDQVLFYS